MINQLLFGGTTLHTSSTAGIESFFGGTTWRNNNTAGTTRVYTYTPGIPVFSSVKFFTEQFFVSGVQQKKMFVTINPGQSNSISSTFSDLEPVLNFSGLLEELSIFSDTSDPTGDDFTFKVLEIDGHQLFTQIDTTTLSIP